MDLALAGTTRRRSTSSTTSSSRRRSAASSRSRRSRPPPLSRPRTATPLVTPKLAPLSLSPLRLSSLSPLPKCLHQLRQNSSRLSLVPLLDQSATSPPRTHDSIPPPPPPRLSSTAVLRFRQQNPSLRPSPISKRRRSSCMCVWSVFVRAIVVCASSASLSFKVGGRSGRQTTGLSLRLFPLRASPRL